ncbi:glycosyltransferase family 2 protein [Enterococcus sp. HY326]|uniref:glycosyltransferase family 2 protein n=1 Tax=Enterococcus sp. HY326 TaxID=2971265 RepID=UPI00223FBEB5|nr:glycosyltransferase [Enterococcus sp. HY326]
MEKNMRFTAKYVIVLLFSIIVVYTLNIVIEAQYPIYLQIVMVLNLLFIYSKFIFSYLYKRRAEKKKTKVDFDEIHHSVDVIIPCYNEDIEVIKSLFESLGQQDYHIHKIIFIDDCSTDTRAYEYVKELKENYRFDIHLHRLNVNSGKLEALMWGIERATSTYLLFLDADGYIATDTIRRLMEPMIMDEKVGAVCGQVVPLNAKVNHLTKMQTILYYNSYHLGRQFQAYFNRVLVCSGAISMYQRAVIMEDITRLKYTKIRNKERKTGDDIALTNIVINQGYKTVYAELGICYTSVPTTLKDFFNQQVRWAKDAYYCFFEELFSIVRNPLFFLLQFQEVFFWLLSITTFCFFIYSMNIIFSLEIIGLIILFDTIIYLLNNFYVMEEKVSNFVKVFIYDVEYRLLLLFIRFYALLSFGKMSWKKHSTQMRKEA